MRIHISQKKLKNNAPLLLVVVAVAALGVYTMFFSQAATNYYLATSGSDSNPCTQSQPCLSFNRALQVAQRGDTVQVAAGTYAPQYLTRVPAGTSGYVVFQPANGATVQIGNGGTNSCKGSTTTTFWQLCVEGSDWIELKDFKVFNDGIKGAIGVVKQGSGIGTDNIILRNMSALSVRLQGRVDNIQIIGGDYGGDLTDGTFSHVSHLDTSGQFPSNVTFDGVRFYNIQSDTSGDHMECILANAFTNLTLINSRFEMCGQNGQSTANIHFNDDLGASSGYTIRNNFFGNNGGQREVMINGDIAGTKIFEFNSIDGEVEISDGFAGGPMIVRGNYGRVNCVTGVTYEYNVTTSSACSGTGNTQVSSLNFVDASTSTWNLHLTPGANAIGKVASNCPADDIDAQSRPATNCDAGADQYASGGGDTTPPDTSITSSTPANGASTTSTTAFVSFTGTDNVTPPSSLTYECSLDSTTTYSTCTSAKNYTGLPVGSHTIRVRAKDAAGNTDASPASITFTVTATSTCSTKQGDTNNDQAVNILDISAILSAYGQTSTTNCADVTKDGSINIQDISLVLSEYGNTSNPPVGGCALPAYPDANCTGVPAGTALTTYSGPLVITTPNTVIDSKTINGKIEVRASGVIIKKSVIHGGVYSEDQAMYGKVGVLVEDSEIDCGGAVGSHGVGEANFTLRRVEITQCENGIDANQNILIEDSYIHNLSHNGADPHEDGIQLGAGFWNGSTYISNGLRNITVRHSTIFGMGNPNDSVFGTSAWIGGPVGADGILIENNLLAGGAYTVYCSRQGENPTSYRLINNRFTTRFKSTVGFYGVSSDCANDYQSGNVIHETGQPIILGD